MIALVDIDGTIADISHRLHYIKSDGTKYIPDDAPVDWDSFFNAMVDDIPIDGMCKLIQSLNHVYDIIYITGRPDSHRKQTEEWLNNHKFPLMLGVYMRTTGDHRPDYLVKRELYEAVLKDMDAEPTDVKIAIEDRKQVVDMWRSLGILTLQPKDGDY